MDDDIEKRLLQLQAMDLAENKPGLLEKIPFSRLDVSREERLAFKLLNGVYSGWRTGR